MTGLIISDPTHFETAIVSSRIIPGDTLLLRSGTYTGIFEINIAGSDELPVTIQPYPGENVRINGGIKILGSTPRHLILRNLEIAPTPSTRTYVNYEDWNEQDLPVGCDMPAPNVTLINCIIHDCEEGIALFGSGVANIYGCLFLNNGAIYSNGLGATDYAIYTHNDTGGARTIKHNVFTKSFGPYGIHAFSGGNKVQDYLVDGNVFLGADVIFESGQEVNNISFANNLLYDCLVRVGSVPKTTNKQFSMIGNHQYNIGINPTGFNSLQDLTFTDNTLVYIPGAGFTTLGFTENPNGMTNCLIDRNSYHHVMDPSQYPFSRNGVFYYWNDWRALGYDANSTFDRVAPSNFVKVIPNEYAEENDPRKGIVAVVNYEGKTSESVNLSSLNLSNGTQYKLRQVLDPFVDVVTFTYNGITVNVDMQAASHSVAIPTGHDVAIASNSFPMFGCWLVEKA